MKEYGTYYVIKVFMQACLERTGFYLALRENTWHGFLIKGTWSNIINVQCL